MNHETISPTLAILEAQGKERYVIICVDEQLAPREIFAKRDVDGPLVPCRPPKPACALVGAFIN